MSILTKLRGALGTATTWAMTWGLGGLAFGSALAFLDPSIPNHWWWGIAKAVGVSSAVAGFSSGVFFSGFLGTVHRNKQIGDLRPFRMGLWGAGAGILTFLGVCAVTATLPPVREMLVVIGTISAMGMATGGGMVKLAQASERNALGSPERGSLGSGQA